MTAVAVMTSETSPSIGKKELCARLNWARPTLDRRLNADPRFPVRTRGGKGGGWEFDYDQVLAYLNGAPPTTVPITSDGYLTEEVEEPDEPIQFEEARQARQDGGRLQHRGEVTSRQLRDHADADLKIDRLKRTRGELVEASLMRQALETILVELRSGLLAMPDSLVKEFGLTERVGFAMKGKIEGMMRTSVLSLKKQLAVDIDPASPGQPG